MSRLLATALLLAAIAGCASLPDPEPRLAAFEARAEMCAHWGGEYDYDAERAAQIRAALSKGRCDALDDDAGALKAAYRSDPAALARIEAAMAAFQ
ncbi:hypothetical protein [Brevundimonas sp. GCM10030266]|uniref:hypothetical protein n=1 Tax=Brevundimonas sp. GCM10030266 TaxID=3273386 RepID=UPI003622977B